ncbi:MAG: hypothetical protein QXT19_03635 [Candidatus Woesearchaeota archaeon]
MADEYEKQEQRKGKLGLVCVLAATGATIFGVYSGITYYKDWKDKKVATVEKNAFIGEIEQVNQRLERIITKLESDNDLLEERAKDRLRKLLAITGVSEEKEVEYFHQIMQDEKGRATFREYIEECASNKTKPCKEGFKRYVSRKMEKLDAENDQLEKKARTFMRKCF